MLILLLSGPRRSSDPAHLPLVALTLRDRARAAAGAILGRLFPGGLSVEPLSPVSSFTVLKDIREQEPSGAVLCAFRWPPTNRRDSATKPGHQ